MTEVMELNWTESKQDNNKNYTKTMIGIVENGLPNDIVIKPFRLIFNSGNHLEIEVNDKEDVIKVLTKLEEKLSS